MTEWFSSYWLHPGTILAEWSRLHREPQHRAVAQSQGDPEDDRPGTRIDLNFKPVDALNVRTRCRTLKPVVASEARATEVPGAGASTDDRRVSS